MHPSAECPPLGPPSSCLATRMRVASSARTTEGSSSFGQFRRMPFQVQASVSTLGKIPVVSLSIFVTVATYLLAATQIQLPNAHLLTFSLACLTQLKSSSLGFPSDTGLSDPPSPISQCPWRSYSRKPSGPHTQPARMCWRVAFPLRVLVIQRPMGEKRQ